MSRRERIYFALLWFFLGLIPLFLSPLREPDEARYAEIPREMLARGDWLTPRLNDVLYFEKPPLQYWLSAASMKVFGLNAIAARTPLAIATIVSLWCVWRLARRAGSEQPLQAVLMASTALLAYCCGQILTLDALFTALLLLALTSGLETVMARYQGHSGLAWTLLSFSALGMAILTKGLVAPVLLGGTVFCSLPWAWKDRRLRSVLLRTFFHPLGWLLLLGISIPWFVAIERAHPGHAQFFFINEHFRRFTTHVHHRQGAKNPLLDKLYFILLLVPGLMPWLSSCVGGMRRGIESLRVLRPSQSASRLQDWTTALLVMAVIVPVVFFSLSGSKLPPYILPVVGPAVVLAAKFIGDDRIWVRRAGTETLVLGSLFLVVCLAPRLLKDRSQVVFLIPVATAYLMLGLWLVLQPAKSTLHRLAIPLGGLCLLLSWGANHVLGRSTERLAHQAPAHAQWISAGNYFQLLPFISRSPVTVVDGIGELAYGVEQLDPVERDRRFYSHLDDLNQAGFRMRVEHPDRPVWALISMSGWRSMPEERRRAWDKVDQTTSVVLLRLSPIERVP